MPRLIRQDFNLYKKTKYNPSALTINSFDNADEKYRMLLQIAPTAIYEIDFKSQKLTCVNDKMCQLSGYSREELLSMNPSDLIIDTEGRKRYRERILKMAAGLEVDETVEYKIKTKSKLEAWVQLNTRLIYKDGRLDSGLIVAHDITLRKHAEEIIRNNEKYLHLLVNAIPQQVYVTDLQGEEIYNNEKRLEYFGSRNKTISQSDWKRVIHPDDEERVEKLWKTAMKTGHIYEVEYRLKNSLTHKYHWFLSRAIPIKNDKGQITAWFGTATCIDEQKQLQEKKDQFITIASHELKTPMTAIKAYTQLMQKRLSKKDTQTNYLLDRLNAQVDKLNELVFNLLDVSKIESNKILLNLAKIDIDQMINKIIKDYRLIARSHKFIRIGKLKEIVVIDEDRIGQVLINLLSNAVKYSPNGSKIIIRTCKSLKNKTFTISIEDFGTGIDQKYFEKIFERFYRVSEKNNYISGFGLGLYISKEIIKGHSGKIWVANKNTNGSVFTFTLPLIPLQ